MGVKLLTENEIRKTMETNRGIVIVDQGWERIRSGDMEVWADGDGIVFLNKDNDDYVMFEYHGWIDDVVKFLTTAYGNNLVAICYLSGDDYDLQRTIMFLKSGFKEYLKGEPGGIVEMRYANA